MRLLQVDVMYVMDTLKAARIFNKYLLMGAFYILKFALADG